MVVLIKIKKWENVQKNVDLARKDRFDSFK